MTILRVRFLMLTVLAATGLVASSGFGQGGGDGASPPGAADPEQVIAYQGRAVLTQAEIDAAFRTIPEDQRLAFIRDGARVDQLIVILLKRKLLAAEARDAGFDRGPAASADQQLAADRELSDLWLGQVMANAPAADYEALAQEEYLANPDRYRHEDVLDVSHILVSADGRGFETAHELAVSLRERLAQDPSQFDALVAESSDDPSKARNQGRFAEVRRGQMAKPFERAAFALQQAGEISDPVKTNYGYHIIRLNGRSGGDLPPFESIREAAVERMRQNYLEQYRARYLRKLTREPIVVPDGAVEIMARRWFGDDLQGVGQPR